MFVLRIPCSVVRARRALWAVGLCSPSSDLALRFQAYRTHRRDAPHLQSNPHPKDKNNMPVFHLNPFLADSASVKAYLLGQASADDEEHVHPFVNNGKRYLWRASRDSTGTVTFQDEEILPGSERQFLDNVSANEAAAQVATNVETYRSQLGAICDYEVSVLVPGKCIAVPFASGEIHLFCVTKKTSQYFDLVLHVKHEDGWQSVNYSSRGRRGGGVTHSGDIGSLLHHIKLDNGLETGQVALLNVVGFRQTPLRKFKDQLPTLLIVDHEEKVVHLVPCPLDERTMGDNTMAALCGIRRTRTELEICALSTPQGLPGVDTGTMNQIVEATAERAAEITAAELDAAEDARVEQARLVAEANVTAGNATINDAFALLAVPANETTGADPSTGPNDAPMTEVVPSLSTFAIVEARLDCQRIMPAYAEDSDSMVVVATGSAMYRVQSLDELQNYQEDPSGADLPLGFAGTLSGSPSLALGAQAQGFPAGMTAQSFSEMLRQSGLLVAHLSGAGMERSLSDAQHKANAIFILHGALPSSDKVTENSFNGVDITGFTSRRGPCATLLLQSSDGRRFFYSAGSIIPGLMDHLPEFGQDVTDIFTDDRIKAAGEAFRSGPYQKPFANLVAREVIEGPVGERPIILGLQQTTISGLETHMSNLSVSDLQEEDCKDIDAIRCALAQTSALLSTSELKPTRERLTKSLQAVVESFMAPFREKRAALMKKIVENIDEHGFSPGASADTSKELKMLKEEMKAASRFAGRVLKPLVTQVASMVSVQRSSNRQLDLARVAKLDQMKANRDAIEEMDWETLGDRLCELCGEGGFVFTTVDPEINRQMLEGVVARRFVTQTLGNGNESLVSFDPRSSGVIDCWTALALNEVTQGRAHDLSGPEKCFTIPANGQYVSGIQASQVCLPLLDMDVQLKDVGDVFWPSTPEGGGGCNDPDRALARYLVRQIFIQSNRARSLNMTAHASSVDLTYYCAHFILTTMEGLVGVIGRNGFPSGTGPTSPLWNDATRVILRGLTGLFLSFVSSGADPASNIWCVVQRGSKMPLPKAGQGEWILLARFVDAFPHTCWPTKTVVKNCQTLLTRVTKAMADAFLKPMRNSMTQMKGLELAENIENRNKELEVAFWAASMLRSSRETPPPLDVTRRVLRVILDKYAGKENGEAEAILMLKNISRSRRQHHGTVRLLDALIKYVRSEGEISVDAWKKAVQVADNVWEKRVTRAINTPWRVHAGRPDRTIDEQKAVVLQWKAEFDQVYAGEKDCVGASVVSSLAAAESVPLAGAKKSALMLAIDGKPGNERGALAIAQMLESEGDSGVSVQRIFEAYQRAGSTASSAAISPKSISSLLVSLGYESEKAQARVIGEILKTFLVMWRADDETTWNAAIRVWQLTPGQSSQLEE